jgi:hypothetical protein
MRNSGRLFLDAGYAKFADCGQNSNPATFPTMPFRDRDVPSTNIMGDGTIQSFSNPITGQAATRRLGLPPISTLFFFRSATRRGSCSSKLAQDDRDALGIHDRLARSCKPMPHSQKRGVHTGAMIGASGHPSALLPLNGLCTLMDCSPSSCGRSDHCPLPATPAHILN